MTFYIKRNDTSPAIEAQLQDDTGAAINITGATVRFHMQSAASGEVVVNEVASIVTPLTGVVRYDWAAEDTATAGQFAVEWQVTYSDGSIETFPNNGNAWVQITPDLA